MQNSYIFTVFGVLVFTNGNCLSIIILKVLILWGQRFFSRSPYFLQKSREEAVLWRTARCLALKKLF